VSKYQEGDYRRNSAWKRKTRIERKLAVIATQRSWTPREWAWRCEKVRNLMATGMSKREAVRKVDGGGR